LTGTKIWRLSLAAILGFGWLFLVPQNAYADCVNYIQSQAIAAAYEGDEEPTVHTMDTCGGDDISYQIPIATTITFDGVQYSNIYATTNSVITFGQPDGTYWTYPSTPSISLYSMDWVSGWYNAPDTLNISYSEGGFQLDLEVIPFGQWNTPTPSNINIIVAITNTGGISVAYSYQGPEYPNLRTGVRLHDGSIVSLEEWGATQITAGQPMPSLSAEPIAEPTPTPTGPTQEQIAFQEEARVTASLIANAIAAANNEVVVEPVVDPEPTPEPSPEPTIQPTPEPTNDSNVIVVEPEVVTPEDPRFPDGEGQTEPSDPTPTPNSETTNEPTPEPSPEPEQTVEPSPEPSPLPSDIDLEPTPEPEPTPAESLEEPSGNIITELVPEKGEGTAEDLSRVIANLTSKDNKLVKLTSEQMAAIGNTLLALTNEAKSEVAKDFGVKSNEIEILAETAKDNPAVAIAIATFAEKAKENINAPMPYTVADAITEAQTEQFLSDPIGALTNIDLEKVFSPSEWGKDMTDDQREKAQEVIVPVIIASNIVAAAMTRRI
jgi:hypothetical protein